MFTAYEVVTLTRAAPSADEGEPQQVITLSAPAGKVILGATAYYYADYENAPTDLSQAYDEPAYVSISSDGTTADILSAPVVSAQYSSNAVVQLICAQVAND